ncbi:MFS transporter [Amycolatopsis rhizosphaerae]|uniref:MFS transporter n=1 Tax=Amycolatopsis rhizosphaerae TaxID=2053003 RepID=A0A558ANE9_9PSEU|nr:MFS transporter [Amycolatopsis rhizosphaerae]TVT25788.1 MFS transporter [Amycolatopsis rhizosphaerae]
MTHALTRPTEAQAPPPGVRPDTVVAVLAFSGIVVSLMQTLIIPLVPVLPQLLGASASDTSWAITATLLAAAIATPTMGRLGDMYGKRRLLLVSVAMLVVGSVVCALSSALAPMVVGRALQGLSSGVIPLGISIMRDELPVERLAGATALMSASLGVGGALGLPAAAFLAEKADWHVLFWTAAGLGAVAAVLVFSLVPESKVRAGGRFDLPGALGMSVALLCLLLAISKGSDWGWGSGLTLGLLGAAVVILLAWGRWELRTPQPLVDLRTTARRQVLLTNIASVVFGFAMFAMSLAFPQLIELPKSTGYGLGQTMLVAGLAMAPGGLLMMATAPLSARISRTMGPKVTLMAGAVVVAAGYGLSVLLMSAVWQLMIGAAVVSAGIGLAYGAMPALVMGAVPVSETAAANSLNTLMRSIGTSVSSAVAGVILAHVTMKLGPLTLPAQNGFRIILAVSACAALGALVIAAFLPGRRPSVTARPAAESAVPGSPAAGEISGSLRTTAGAVVADGTVTVTGPDGRQVSRARSGADGDYAVRGLRPGTYTIIVTAAGFEPEAVSVSLDGAGAVRDFALAGGGVVTGVVRRTGGAAPVAGATVAATDVAGRVVGSTDCAEDGTFSLTGLPTGEITVVAQLPSHVPHAETVVITGREPAVADLFLRAIGRLHGTVTDPGGRGLARATVSVAAGDGDLVASIVTDEDGRYELRDLAPGEYTVVTSLYTPTVRHVSLTVGEPVIVDVDLVATQPR